jgi:ferredoxin
MECFYQDEMMLYIDPTSCIDCDACAPECPVGAIFQDTRVPNEWAQFIQRNADRSAALKDSGGHITERQDAKEGPGCRQR